MNEVDLGDRLESYPDRLSGSGGSLKAATSRMVNVSVVVPTLRVSYRLQRLQSCIGDRMITERISIELTNRCSKQCSFCYNHSNSSGDTVWMADEIVSFVSDCASSGTKAISFGGGEPLEYPDLFDVLQRLDGLLFRSLTSNGLKLDSDNLDKLVAARPDKVHISLHFPDRPSEVTRVIQQVRQLASLGIRSGINLLVARSNLAAAIDAAKTVRNAGIENDRIVYLPMRGTDTPTPQEMATVAGNKPFQSMTCLAKCDKSPRFCSISWDKKVGWCSYTSARHRLAAPTAKALEEALQDLPLVFCGKDLE